MFVRWLMCFFVVGVWWKIVGCSYCWFELFVVWLFFRRLWLCVFLVVVVLWLICWCLLNCWGYFVVVNDECSKWMMFFGMSWSCNDVWRVLRLKMCRFLLKLFIWGDSGIVLMLVFIVCCVRIVCMVFLVVLLLWVI